MAGRRFFLVLGVATGLTLLFGGIARASTAPPDPSSENGFLTRIQYERSSRNISTLSVASDLVAIARQHSADMASQHRLYDDPNMRNEVQNWQAMGDNVGAGGSVDQVHQAFMNSPGHRDNILNPVFTEVGVGVVWSGSTLWVTEIFRQPMPATAPAPTPAPTPPPTPPAPKPAPTAPGPTPKASPPRPATLLPATTTPPATTPPVTTTITPAPAPPPTAPTLIAAIAGTWQPSPLALATPPPLRRSGRLPAAALGGALALLAADLWGLAVALRRLRPSAAV